MYSAHANTALPVLGFPIRESAGQRLFSTSPRLIAAVHALLRLLMPRHPPCALTILTVIAIRQDESWLDNGDLLTYLTNCAVFKVRRGAQPEGLPGWSLKTQQCGFELGDAVCGARAVDSRSGRHSRHAVDVSTYDGLPCVRKLPRKEVIQPHLPVRLPCYDFTPITSPTFDGSLPRVGSPASGVACFRGVTGGVYKARERIHPGIADPGLLATPPSWRRVSASNPNRDRLFGIRSTSRYRSPLYRPM